MYVIYYIENNLVKFVDVYSDLGIKKFIFQII